MTVRTSLLQLLPGKAARAVAVLAAAVVLLALMPGAALAAHPAGETRRIRGEEPNANRFGTAVEIAFEAYPDGTDAVVLARADNFADALAGSLLAGRLDAPILLSESSRLTGVTEDALETLASGTAGGGSVDVYLLGGTNALDTTVQTRLESLAFVGQVVRIFGETRFETAQAITDFVDESFGTGEDFGTAPENRDPDGDELVTGVLANGLRFADPLASAPFAFGNLSPLLLTANDTLHPASEEAITEHGIEQLVIPGGQAAVSDAVEAEVQALGVATIRVNDPGGDRASTAVELAEYIRETIYPPLSGDNWLTIATGIDRSDGADALALAPLAFKLEADLILSRGINNLDGSIGASGDPQPSTFLEENCASFGGAMKPATLAGGVQAISTQVEEQISDLIICEDFVATGDLTLTPETATNVIGTDHTVTATGINPKGDPAEGAGITFEVYSDNPLRADPDNPGKTYVEAAVTYFFVESGTATLDAEGEADFTYPQDDSLTIEPQDGDEDRIVACHPPSPTEPSQFTCVDETGSIPQGTPYGVAVAEKSWIRPADADATFEVGLFSGNEVGDPGTVADAEDGVYGVATVSVFLDENFVCADIRMTGAITDVGSFDDAGAHLHEAPAGVAGPVVVPWDSVDDETKTSSSCTTPTDVTGAEIIDAPADYYVNVHSSVFPAGAARAQLDGTDSVFPEGSDELFPAGEHEVGENDPDSPNLLGPAGGPAQGEATFDYYTGTPSGDLICYFVRLDPETVEGEFAGAPGTHIHEGAAGVNDAVVQALRPLDDTSASVFACDVATDPLLIPALIATPEGFYLNVHTTTWPGGAARAQFDGVDDGNPDDEGVVTP